MRQTLLPYREYSKNMYIMYIMFRDHVHLNLRSHKIFMYLKIHCDKNDFTFVFMKKIVQKKEIKLKEFNFINQLLQGILPCNTNLMKWKIRMSDECDVCQHQQSIEYHCLIAFMLSHYGK